MRKHMLLRNPNYTVSLWLPVQSTPAGELFHFVFVPLLPIRWVHGSRSSVAGLRSQVLCFQMCVYVWEVCTCVYERVHACTNTCTVSLCKIGWPELMILLPQPPKCWDYRCVSPQLAREFFFCSAWAWTQGLHLEPLHQPFFVMVFFFFFLKKSKPFLRSWFWISTPLVSASWVARIIGVNHQHSASWEFLMLNSSAPCIKGVGIK
jgi:hypothetical protein